MDRNVARAIKLQTVKVAVGLLLIGGLLGARVVSVKRADAAPAPASTEVSTDGPLTTKTVPAPPAASSAQATPPSESAPEGRSFFEAMGVGHDSDEPASADVDRPGRCELPGQGIQFMRAADCQNLGGAFTPLSKKKSQPGG